MLVTLVAVGFAVARYKIELTRDIRFIGHSDRAAYVEMGRSLANGDGLSVRYISYFFIPYSRDIVRREDHWPPFMAFMIAPWFKVFGVNPWAARLAPILIGSIALPVTTGLLGYVYSGRSYVGLASGLLILTNLSIFDESLSTMSDVPLAMLVAAFCAAVIAGRDRPYLHLFAGLLAAAVYLAKGSFLWLIPSLPVIIAMACRWKALRRRCTYLSVVVAALAIAPYLISNSYSYGSPFHSTQRYVSGYFGLADWSKATYKPYWGRDLPRTSDRWTKDPEAYARLVRSNQEQLTRYALFGSRPEHPDPVSMLCSVSAIVFLGVLLFKSVWQWLRSKLCRMRQTSMVEGDDGSIQTGLPMRGPTMMMLAVLLVHWLFIVFLWVALPRFALVFVPITIVIGCTGMSRLMEWPMFWFAPGLRKWSSGITVMLAVFAVTVAAVNREGIKQYHREHSRMDQFPYRDQPFYPAVGDYLRERLPNAVVMANNPWDFMFYSSSGNKAVKTPQAKPADLFSIARYYRVTHYLADEDRPGMRLYTRGWLPGLKRVRDAPAPLYELDYSSLPDSGLTGTSFAEAVSK